MRWGHWYYFVVGKIVIHVMCYIVGFSRDVLDLTPDMVASQSLRSYCHDRLKKLLPCRSSFVRSGTRKIHVKYGSQHEEGGECDGVYFS